MKTVQYRGKLFEVCTEEVVVHGKQSVFEYARRPPGVRLIIVRDGEILLTRERRWELNGYDYRLPGGKVFDSFDAYSGVLAADIQLHAEKAARRECMEETGLIPTSLDLFHVTSPGGTVIWDLFYYVVTGFEVGVQNLEHGEDITPLWKSFDEAKELCIAGEVREDRTVGVLLRYLLQNQ